LTDVVTQLYPVLAVIINGSKAIIDFAGRKNKPIFFAVGNDFFEEILVVHWKVQR
jgi:hypothetical protein